MGECLLYPKHQNRCEVISGVHKTFSSISLIASFSIVVLIVLLKQYEMLTQRMILFMVISAFLNSITYLLGNVDTTDGHTCRFQSFLMQYTDWCTLLWLLMFSVNMILTVRKVSTVKYHWLYHVVVWIGSMVWAVIPFAENAYGHAGLWCWIKRDFTNYRFGTWFGPLLVICILMFLIFLYVIYFVYQHTKADAGHTVETQAANKRYRDEVRPLLFYPLAYVVFTIPTLMYRIEDASHPTNPPNYGLIIIAAIFGPSVGAANAVIFAIVNTKSIRKLTWAKLRNTFYLSFRNEQQAQVVHDIQLETVHDPIETSSSAYHIHGQTNNPVT